MWLCLWSLYTRNTPLLLLILRNIRNVGAKAPAVSPDPLQISSGSAVLDGASGQAYLIRYLVKMQGHAAVSLG